jgi:hypothetical protein
MRAVTVTADTYPTRTIRLTRSVLGGAAPAAPIAIAFRVQRQGRFTQWCWAAVTSSVSTYPDPPHAAGATMCQLASDELHKPCCADPLPDGCNEQNTLDGPLDRIGRLRAPIITGHLGPNAVATELAADLPVPIRIEWTRSGNGGHFLAIYGIRTIPAGVQLAVSDPIYGESAVMGAALIAGGYLGGGGKWTHSYVVTP